MALSSRGACATIGAAGRSILCFVVMLSTSFSAGAQPAPDAPYPPPGVSPYPPPPAPVPYPPPYAYGYPPVPVYVAPPAPAAQLVVEGWDPNVPAPEGYHLVDEANGRLLNAGIGFFGASWLTTVLVAGVASSGDNDDASGWAPLYLPIAGPFVAVRTLHADRFGTSVLLSDGIMQLGGAFGIVAGIVDRTYDLYRYDLRAPPVAPTTREQKSMALIITGSSLAGLGAATVMASGIVWLVAAGDASTAHDQCPNKVCIAGSTGAEALTDARSAEHASAVLFAVSLPVTTAGLVLLSYAGGFRTRSKTVGVTPMLGPHSGGGTLEVRF